MAIKLLIVDDDPGITSALARGLALHGYEAVAEHRAERAYERLTSEAYEGAIIDVMLGCDSGIDLVRKLRAAGAAMPVLMLSALSEVEHRAAGLDAGADDYIVKPFSFEELVARLRVQEHRAKTIRPMPSILHMPERKITTPEAEILLTEREFSLLSLLLDQKGKALSRGEIFDNLWAVDGSTTENVVDVYIGYLRKKIAGKSVGFNIRTRRNKGFYIEGVLPKQEG